MISVQRKWKKTKIVHKLLIGPSFSLVDRSQVAVPLTWASRKVEVAVHFLGQVIYRCHGHCHCHCYGPREKRVWEWDFMFHLLNLNLNWSNYFLILIRTCKIRGKENLLLIHKLPTFSNMLPQILYIYKIIQKNYEKILRPLPFFDILFSELLM